LNTIKFIISPGSRKGFGDGPKIILPTGEKSLVMSEYRQIQFNEKPDAHGSIVMLNTPFFEAPFIRVYLNQEGGFHHWEARQIPGYENSVTVDPLKENAIYGWRMVGNSLTGYNMTAPLSQAGSVTVASLPLSIDVKHVYNDDNLANPISYVRCLDRLPVSASTIANITNHFAVNTATEGSYVCLRHTNPHIPFTFRDSDINKATFNVYYISSGAISPPTYVGNQARVNYLAWSDASNPGTYLLASGSDNRIGVTMPSTMDVGITCYEGLPSTTEITFKGMCCWEFIPKMNSTKINQCSPMAPLDSMFLDALNTAEVSMPCFGVATDNGFGTFIKGLVNVVSKATPFIKSIAGALPPQYSCVVNAVADAIPKVNAVVNTLVKDNNKTKQKVNKIENKLASSLVTPSVKGMARRQ
jgi:hypothetical protein